MKKKSLLLTGILLALFFVCVDTVDAEEPLKLQYAKGFSVEFLGGSKLVTVRPAWQKEGSGFHYLLVPEGQAVPAKHPPAQIIRVPVKRIVALSTTHLAYIDAAGRTDRLVGLAGFDYVNTPSVRQRIAAGKLKAVGHFTSLRMETLIDLAPDLIAILYPELLPDHELVYYRRLLRVTIMLGGDVALAADLLAQLPGSQTVLPLNAMTALLGSPVIVWLIVGRKNLTKTFGT